MTIVQAMEKMGQGIKLRHETWKGNDYIHLDETTMKVVNRNGEEVKFMMSDGWEVYGGGTLIERLADIVDGGGEAVIGRSRYRIDGCWLLVYSEKEQKWKRSNAYILLKTIYNEMVEEAKEE